MPSRFYLALVLVALGCDSGAVDPLANKTRAFVTYNLGLAKGYVDYAEERRPHLVELLAGLDADVLCLDEVWTQDDVEAVLAGVAEAFPYSHYKMLEDTTVGPPACGQTESEPLIACLDLQCQGVSASEIAGCALSKCRPEFDALSDGCTSCLAANIGKEVDEMISLCQTGSAKYSYSGANGLLVLSRAKLERPEHFTMDSTLVQGSVLAVTVELPRLGTVAIACTHLAADLTSSGVPYTGSHASWEGENRYQAETVRDFMATYGAGADLKLILGDLNSGPPFPPDVAAELPAAAHSVFTEARYRPFPSSLSDASGKVCTFCADNTLNADTIPSVQIDHLMLDALPAAFTPIVTRLGTVPVAITLRDGTSLSTHPSDHYGVRLDLVAFSAH